jgi:hypothetical protein
VLICVLWGKHGSPDHKSAAEEAANVHGSLEGITIVRLFFLASCYLAVQCSYLMPQAMAAEHNAPRKIILYGNDWKAGQVNEPCILVNPKNPTMLIMFYSGMKLGGKEGCIGKAWANVADPFNWHEDERNPILRYAPQISFEASGIRLDSVIYREETNEYWIYYTGTSAKPKKDAIGLAICPAGHDGYTDIVPANIKRHENNPVLFPQGQGRADETHVSQGAVFREKDKWYSFYSYRTTQNILPGIRLATSDDGIVWTKTVNPDLLTAAPESRYIEWHQIYKIGDRYVMMYEAYNGGVRWRANVAVSSRLTEGWKKLPVTSIDQMEWPTYSDQTYFHVATPALYQIGTKWYLFFQAAPRGAYSIQHWTLWGMECDDVAQETQIDGS